mgnify:FL=1
MKKENIVLIMKRIKKEHFIKTILWVAGIVLTLFWIAFVIATSISAGRRTILADNEIVISIANISTLQDYLQNDNYIVSNLSINETTGVLESINFKKIIQVLDWNPLCLTYDSKLIGWYMLVLLAPIGYMSCIYIIAVIKNTITPGAIKKTIRKALQFGYLRQRDVEYIIDEIDYNIGIKERPQNETNNQEDMEQDN